MIDDVPEAELWDFSYFEDFRVRLVNGDGAGDMGEIIDFAEWVKGHRG